jgi:hypothetical protein
MDLASGRFAMIDDGLGFQLVPWSPSLEQQLGRHVSGVVRNGGGIDWTLRPQARPRHLTPIRKGPPCPRPRSSGARSHRLPDRADDDLGRDAVDRLPRSAISRSSGRPGSSFGWPVYPPPPSSGGGFPSTPMRPPIFVEGAYHRASGGFISIAVAIGMSVWRAREAKNVETYGSARWARARGARAGLLGPDGVVLGKLDRDYLRHDGPEHVLCFAPTRSAARASAWSCRRC